jgi:N-acetylglucosamine malate deacetylase 2
VLGACGIAPDRIRMLGYTDQEAALHLAEIARTLARLFVEERIEAVLTHPYEGGHPDHDASAFCVRASCLVCSRGGRQPSCSTGRCKDFNYREYLPVRAHSA